MHIYKYICIYTCIYARKYSLTIFTYYSIYCSLSVRRQIDEEELEKGVGEEFINFCARDELDVEIAAVQLIGYLKDGHVTNLVRAGYLTSEVTGKVVRYLKCRHVVDLSFETLQRN